MAQSDGGGKVGSLYLLVVSEKAEGGMRLILEFLQHNSTEDFSTPSI